MFFREITLKLLDIMYKYKYEIFLFEIIYIFGYK